MKGTSPQCQSGLGAGKPCIVDFCGYISVCVKDITVSTIGFKICWVWGIDETSLLMNYVDAS